MSREAGKIQKTYTESADGKYLYGTKEEQEGRLENEYPSMESHFQQVRPASDLSPRGKNANEMAGRHPSTKSLPTKRNGTAV